MRTVVTKSATDAAAFIKKGGIVAFPTETVYGLGANVFDENAIAKIFKAKQRPNDNPLIAHIGNLAQINLLASEISNTAQKFIDELFPGPLTLVLPKSAKVPENATAGLDTIGIRMPSNQLAREFLEACGVPLVAPSANLSGKPSPTTWEAVFEDLNGRINCILQGEPTEIGLESTVVDCSGDVPLVLRSGAISIEQLRDIVAATKVYQGSGDEKPRSPGLKHRHYSPKAKVVLVNSQLLVTGPASNAFIGLNSPGPGFELVKLCSSVEDYAHSLFAFFRECDHRRIETIYCEIVPETGLGIALMDRIRRASEG